MGQVVHFPTGRTVVVVPQPNDAGRPTLLKLPFLAEDIPGISPMLEESRKYLDPRQVKRDATYLLQNLDTHDAVLERADAMDRYLFKEIGHDIAASNIVLNRKYVQYWAMGVFCERILAGERKNWAVKPHFYSSLAVEYRVKLYHLFLETSHGI